MNNEDHEIAALLSDNGRTDTKTKKTPGYDRVDMAVKRARESLAQHDTLAFILVKLWATIAKILAPIFAQAAKHQAKNLSHLQSGKIILDSDRH